MKTNSIIRMWDDNNVEHQSTTRWLPGWERKDQCYDNATIWFTRWVKGEHLDGTP